MLRAFLKPLSQMTMQETQLSLGKNERSDCQEKRKEKLKNMTLKSTIVKTQAGTSDWLAVDVPQLEGSLLGLVFLSSFLSAWV